MATQTNKLEINSIRLIMGVCKMNHKTEEDNLIIKPANINEYNYIKKVLNEYKVEFNYLDQQHVFQIKIIN